MSSTPTLNTIGMHPALPQDPVQGDSLVIQHGNNTFKIDYSALAAAIISQLGTNGIVSILYGGTDANNAADARSNLGLGNVNNTSDTDKPVSTATQQALNDKVSVSEQQLTSEQKEQVQANIGVEIATMAEVRAYLGIT